MRTITAGLAAGIMLAGLAVAQDVPAHKGYLKPGTVDIMSVLPAGPVAGDARYDADRAIFKATRRYAGSPRWEMATKDVSWKDADMLAGFSCALGATVTPKDVPRILALVHKAGDDTQRETNIAKKANKRSRPFLIDAGEICQPAKELADSYDYPSGHTTGGWTWALVLADVAPGRASQIMARGRAYGESRIVCGAHNSSAVEAGRLSATVTMTSVRATTAYQRDLKKAQAEFKALKKPAPDAALCEAERGLVSLNIFAPAP
ncbi:acid phosphatase [Rhizomicrobium electricum]|jgi:acid phosphatase (class A)|uniref:Acid phosphatase n=1 Tax=Rhizomicrobium electricum TaxID=480070 RepID=A0ABP3PTC8_9PROT|nr:phosphatase PAP2 family protein [Rhizomicrobium electricum]NIJ48904.1 acid phosphatase (class A) [Rhizomicrobium electricum]